MVGQILDAERKYLARLLLGVQPASDDFAREFSAIAAQAAAG